MAGTKRRKQYVYLALFYYAEIAVAKKLLELSQEYEEENSIDVKNRIQRVEKETNILLAEQQKKL